MGARNSKRIKTNDTIKYKNTDTTSVLTTSDIGRK